MSLGTVQKALNALALEGSIRWELGRGTFVSDARRSFVGPWHHRFVADGSDHLLPVSSVVTELVHESTDGPWSRELKRSPEGWIRMGRRVGFGEHACFSLTWLRADRFRGLLDVPRAELDEENLRVTLSERFGVGLMSWEQRLRVVALPGEATQALGLERRAGGLMIEVVAEPPRTSRCTSRTFGSRHCRTGCSSTLCPPDGPQSSRALGPDAPPVRNDLWQDTRRRAPVPGLARSSFTASSSRCPRTTTITCPPRVLQRDLGHHRDGAPLRPGTSCSAASAGLFLR
jgi:DNA-binding GntR family transcriptional regulator